MALPLEQLLEKARKNKALEDAKNRHLAIQKKKIRQAEIFKMYADHGVMLDSLEISFKEGFEMDNSQRCYRNDLVEKRLFDYSFFNCKQVITR